jgi:hypothetical protein
MIGLRSIWLSGKFFRFSGMRSGRPIGDGWIKWERRCILPVDGFYEWVATKCGKRRPAIAKRLFRARSHTPCNRCVRFASKVTSGNATLATQVDATPYLGRTFTGWIAPACGWRTYSITSSARASSDDGTVSPSALAVIRLTTRSNLVGCSTGRSAGFVPRNILST